MTLADSRLTEEDASKSKAISIVKQLRLAHQENRRDEVSGSIDFPMHNDLEEQTLIERSSVSLGHISGRKVIVDHVPVHEQSDLDITKIGVRALAQILSKVDPLLFGLLPCNGIAELQNVWTKGIRQFNLFFFVPSEFENATPRILRSLLNRLTGYSLNERFHLALSLARSVTFLHSSSVVHKNISPENIIIFQHESDKIGTPFLS